MVARMHIAWLERQPFTTNHTTPSSSNPWSGIASLAVLSNPGTRIYPPIQLVCQQTESADVHAKVSTCGGGIYISLATITSPVVPSGKSMVFSLQLLQTYLHLDVYERS
jgi:hypothetical protein